ncbi:MAG: UvrD-helicase domain-containing protein [Arsenophonus sp.]
MKLFRSVIICRIWRTITDVVHNRCLVIIVDEFQDTDPEQYQIFQHIHQ